MTLRNEGYADIYRAYDRNESTEQHNLMSINKAKLANYCPYEKLKDIFVTLAYRVEGFIREEIYLGQRFETIRSGRSKDENDVWHYGAKLQERRKKACDSIDELRKAMMLFEDIIMDTLKDQKKYCDKDDKEKEDERTD